MECGLFNLRNSSGVGITVSLVPGHIMVSYRSDMDIRVTRLIQCLKNNKYHQYHGRSTRMHNLSLRGQIK